MLVGELVLNVSSSWSFVYSRFYRWFNIILNSLTERCWSFVYSRLYRCRTRTAYVYWIAWRKDVDQSRLFSFTLLCHKSSQSSLVTSTVMLTSIHDDCYSNCGALWGDKYRARYPCRHLLAQLLVKKLVKKMTARLWLVLRPELITFGFVACTLSVRSVTCSIRNNTLLKWDARDDMHSTL